LKALGAQRSKKGTVKRKVKEWIRRLPRGEAGYRMVVKASIVAAVLCRSALDLAVLTLKWGPRSWKGGRSSR